MTTVLVILAVVLVIVMAFGLLGGPTRVRRRTIVERPVRERVVEEPVVRERVVEEQRTVRRYEEE